MSQAIRKLQKGDKLSLLEKLFKDGNREISLGLIQKNASLNILSYINSKNWSRKKKRAFMSAYSDMLTSLDNGTISERNIGRKYVDSSGKISNTEGKGFDPYGEAAYFLDTIIDNLPTYQKEEITEPKKSYGSMSFSKYFLDKTFGGNKPDMKIWLDRDTVDEKTGKRARTNRAAYFSKMLTDYMDYIKDLDIDFQGTSFSDKEDLMNRLKNASNFLSNSDFNNDDYNALVALGISGDDARNLFSDGTFTEQLELPKEGPSLEELDKLKKLLEINDYINNNYIIPAKDFLRREMYLPAPNYNKEKWGNIIKGKAADFYDTFERDIAKYNPFDYKDLNYNNTALNGMVPWLPHLSNNLDYLGYNMGEDLGNGYYLLPYTINKDNATAIMYNPTTRHMIQDALYNIPWYRDKLLLELYESYKEGGVIKNQQGGYLRSKNLDLYNDSLLKEYEKKRKQEESKKLEESAKASGRTVELEKAGKKVVDEWSGVEWTRVGSAAADVASIVAAFVPVYGTATSAALGVGSTLANLGADIADDSVSAGQAAWNAVQGLGMDVVGLIPGFGAAGKTGKIAKNLIKLTPKLLTLWGASLAYAPAAEALKKLTSDKELTVDDWKALSSGLSAVAGLSRMGAASMKARAYKNAAKTGDKTIKVKSGEFKRISEKQLNELKGKKTLEEANKYLKSIKGFENDELNYTFNRGKNPLKAQFYHTPKTGEHYDFNFTRSTKKGDKPFGSGIDERIYRGAVNSEIGFSIPGIKTPNWIKFNPYRIKKAELATPELPKQIKGLLNTPRYYRLRDKGFTDEELRSRGIYKEGGILKALNGMRNVIGDKSINWNTHIYNTQGFIDTLKKINPENIGTYNNMQNTYGTLGFTNLMPGDNLTYNKNVADYLRLFLDNTLINGTSIADLVKKGLIKGRGYSSDKGVKWTPDGLAGTQTWLRHLGTKDVTPEMLASMNNILRANNVEAFVNNDTGMVNYRVLPNLSQIIKPTLPLGLDASKVTKISNPLEKPAVGLQSSSEVLGDTSKTTGDLNLAKYIPDLISAGRLFGTLNSNNRVTKETLKGLKPLLLSTYNLNKDIVGDLATQLAFYNKAALLENLAYKPRTSDASLWLAGILEGRTKGDLLRVLGDLANNDIVRKTLDATWLVDADNIARRTDVGNRNLASMIGIGKAKHDINAARISANWNSIDTFLKQKELEYKQNRLQLLDFDYRLALQGVSDIMNNPRLLELYTKGSTDPKDVEEFRTLLDSLLRQQREEANKAYANIYGLRYNPKSVYTPRITLSKDGGRIIAAKIKDKTDNIKIFLEGVKESIKAHLKMIDNLSTVTKELILKAMTL